MLFQNKQPITVSGIYRKNGRWFVNGKSFDEMYDYEKLKLSDHIVSIKNIMN